MSCFLGCSHWIPQNTLNQGAQGQFQEHIMYWVKKKEKKIDSQNLSFIFYPELKILIYRHVNL